MFKLTRIFRNKKPLKNYICTSNVIRSDESKKSDESKISKEESNAHKEKEKEELISGEKLSTERKSAFVQFGESNVHKAKEKEELISGEKLSTERKSAFVQFEESNVHKEKEKEELISGEKVSAERKSAFVQFEESNVHKEKEKEEVISGEKLSAEKKSAFVQFEESNVHKAKEKEELISAEEMSPERKSVFALFSSIKEELRSKPKKSSRNFSLDFEKEISSKKTPPPKFEPKTSTFKKMLAASAERVAADMGGNKEETKKDLLQYIKSFEVLTEEPEEEPREVFGRKFADTVMALVEDAEKLNVFNHQEIQKAENQVELRTWDALAKEELQEVTVIQPRNYFEELIQWTNEGKVWRFPIDNDQGRENEMVSFAEHIFLERHLEPWCPKRGPIRKFMELVLIGLSKNHNLTVADKKEHIAWFENYFENKKKLLQELGAIGTTTKQLNVSGPEENS